MTRFSSLGKRLGASFAAALLFAVACAQVDRGYDTVPSGGSAGMGADAGDIGEAGVTSGGKSGSGGNGASGMAGHAGQGAGGSSAGSAGVAGEETGGTGPQPDSALTVALDGTGTGVVTSDVGGINCGAACMASLPDGTQVTLTATPTTGSVFAGWKGAGCTGTDLTCLATASGGTALQVTATFNLSTPTLTVVKAGSGTGTVTSDVAGIACGATCSAPYTYGASVTLTATPDAGSVFTGWMGACTGTSPCTVAVNGTTSVTATFDVATPQITVTKAGTGLGTVTSAPAGITCGATCNSPFTYGTSVVLTATPSTGSTFVGWSGDGSCTGTAPCTVSVKTATAVTATFNVLTPQVTITKGGTGLGTVTSAPAGISCGATCSSAFTYGTSVVLTATPNTGSTFAGWSGDGSCTGTAPCTVSVKAATAVTATFTAITPHITVTKTGTGLGTVTSAPAGISCGATCSSAFTYGASVVLTASPGAGSTFAGWSGAGCSGTGTCTISATADTPVSAVFTCSPGTVTFGYTGAKQTFTVPACVTSLTIDAYGAQGGNAGAFVGGLGARMKGNIPVAGGQVLIYLVGGAGFAATDAGMNAGGSGGGGTFVVTSTNAPLVIAGGGGGAGQYTFSGGQYNSGNGIGGTTGQAGTTPPSGFNPGGAGGLGGTTGSNSGGWHVGTAGGGWSGNGVGNSDGDTVSYGTIMTPGLSFINGGAGGTPNNCGVTAGCVNGRPGGFGGGGAAGFVGGGGGGYSGGAGGDCGVAGAIGAGGGGGSFLIASATVPVAVAATRAGSGQLILNW